MINIALIEDDPIYRTELEKVILFQPNWQCVFSSSSAEYFRENLPARIRINIVFIDIDLPVESGIDILPFITTRLPNTEIIMLTRLESPDLLLRSLNRGARGYLLKNFSPHQLMEHIKIILDGGALISPVMARHLVQYFNPPNRDEQKLTNLSPKETQVLQLLSDGNTYEETAGIVGITHNGVRFHVKNIYSKLNVNNRDDAVKVWKGE